MSNDRKILVHEFDCGQIHKSKYKYESREEEVACAAVQLVSELQKAGFNLEMPLAFDTPAGGEVEPDRLRVKQRV